MNINEVEFVKSSPKVEECPQQHLPEFAFIGRSNVGKSSLINMLCDRKEIAKISSKPGKTQLINHFLVNKSWFLVDLPGYGYAKASKTSIKLWGEMINSYLLKRKNLCCTFVLIDSRHSPLKNDLEFMYWLGSHQIPFAIIFTKMDKSGKITVRKNIDNYKLQLNEQWEELPHVFESSSVKKEGKQEILNFIFGILDDLK